GTRGDSGLQSPARDTKPNYVGETSSANLKRVLIRPAVSAFGQTGHWSRQDTKTAFDPSETWQGQAPSSRYCDANRLTLAIAALSSSRGPARARSPMPLAPRGPTG